MYMAQEVSWHPFQLSFLQAIRAKIDSNPVGALQELCQKVKVVPFYSEVVGAPRHTVQVIISPVL